MVKFSFKLFIFCFIGASLLFSQAVFAEEDDHTCFLYFTGVGCSHCANSDPLVIKDLPKQYPDLFIVEYELFLQRENAPLLQEYHDVYQSGLGVPLAIFDRENYMIGDRPIINGIKDAISDLRGAGVPLIDGRSVNFKELDIASLPGKPKIWHQQKVLIKQGDKGDSSLLRQLLVEDDLISVLKGINVQKIDPLPVALSGGSVEFENAISVGGWIFQWDSHGLNILSVDDLLAAIGSSGEDGEEPPEPGTGDEPTQTLTLAKVLSLAAVDAVNPCAISVLALMLITILSYSKGRKSAVLLGGLSFIFSVFIMYLIYGLIIVKSFQLIEALASVRFLLYKVVGIVAAFMGALKIKDFFQSRKGVCKVNPRVERVLAKVTSPGGAFLVGGFVTIFLLPCTIGPYVICGGVLCPLGVLKSIPWLLFYNLVFVAPMIAVVLLIYFGLSRIEDVSAWQEKNIMYLDLISGLVMLSLGVAMAQGWV